MKIIALERELQSVSGDGAAALYREEARHVFSRYKEGVVREIYLTEQHCAVIILECETVQGAKQILDGFPLVQAGVIAFDVHELRPYPGYGRLMQE